MIELGHINSLTGIPIIESDLVPEDTVYLVSPEAVSFTADFKLHTDRDDKLDSLLFGVRAEQRARFAMAFEHEEYVEAPLAPAWVWWRPIRSRRRQRAYEAAWDAWDAAGGKVKRRIFMPNVSMA